MHRSFLIFLTFILFFLFSPIFVSYLLAQGPPILESANPPYGPPGTLITLSGADLAHESRFGDPKIRICGADARIVQITQKGDVIVRAPRHAMGISQWCDVILMNELGSTTLEDGFTYYEPPPIEMEHRDFLMGFVPILLGPTEDPLLISWYWNDARQIAVDMGDIVSLLYSVWDHCDEGVPHLADLSGAPGAIRWMHENGVQVLSGLEITTGYRDNVWGYICGTSRVGGF